MKIKTVTASTMAEALAMVRRELGAGAVILNTRQFKQGGLLGLGARNVVEITAADGADIAKRNTAAARQRRVAPRQPAAPVEQPTAVEPIANLSAGDLIRRTYAAAKVDIEQKARLGRSALAEEPPSETGHRAVAVQDHSQSLAEEMRTVKRMVERMMHQQRQQPAHGDLPDKLFDQYLCLLRQEVTEELAEEVVGQVRAALSSEQLDDAACVRQAVLDAVAGLIPTDNAARQWHKTSDGRPRTIALVGPTGVGKTTTIAKLAATFKLKQARHVGLITLDTYRIAAVEQLRTYANIIGLPLHVATTPAELTAALAKTRGCDTVLIDTAGRSQRDDPRLEQLRQMVDTANPHEVHLVLSSTCTQAVMFEAVERFSAIRADRIIFTKLDEAVSFGVLLNVARKVNKRLSYITTGQEVPHQIEAGEPQRLAALVMGQGV